MTREDFSYLSDLADPVNESTAYSSGDLVLDDGVLSVCTREGTGSGASFRPASISEVIKALSERVGILEDHESTGDVKVSDLAPAYDPDHPYENGNVVVKDGKLKEYVNGVFTDTKIGTVLNKKMADGLMKNLPALPRYPNQEELMDAVRAMYSAMGGTVSNE